MPVQNNLNDYWLTTPPKCAVVLGASGGLGQAFTAKLRGQFPACNIIPVCHHSTDNSPNKLSVDICSDDSIQVLSEELHTQTQHIDILINCIGLLHNTDIQPEKSLVQLKRETLHHLLDVNAIGPVMLIKALTSLFQRNKPALIASLSARVGSISDNRLGGWYSYRTSKAAANMMLKNLAIEWRHSRPQAVIAMLQPGTVRTALSEPFQHNVRHLFSPEQSASLLLGELLKLSPKESGRFLDWQGQTIPF